MKINWRKIEEYALLSVALSLPLSIALANITLTVAMLLTVRRLIWGSGSAKELIGGITIPLFIYIGVEFIAIFISDYPVHIGSFLEDKWVLSAYFVSFMLVRNSQTANRVVIGQLFAGALVAVYALYQFISGYDPLRKEVLEATSCGFYMAVAQFTTHLTYGGIALIVFLIALSKLIFSIKGTKNYWNYIITVLCAAGLIVSYARSALLGAVIAGLTIIAITEYKFKKYILLCSAAGLVLMFIIVPGLSTRFTNIFAGGEHGEGPRVRLWLSSIEIIKHYPIFGVGQSNFGEAFEEFHIPGRYVSIAHPHCDLLSIGVEGGIVAMLAFCFLWFVYFRKIINLIKSNSLDEYQFLIHRIGFIVPIGILLAGLFQNYLTDAEVANMVWFIIGLNMGLLKRNNTSIDE